MYAKSPENIGYGAGNNLGVKHARGELLFFLSPDTEVIKGSIDILVDFIQKNLQTAIVAPLILKQDKTVYKVQGSRELTPIRAIVGLSFLNTLFPNNPISNAYFLADWDKKHIQEVDAVPGSSFLIKKHLFEQIGGFDEDFFMYFEEHDLGNRIKKLGYKLYIYPEAKVVHLGGRSSKDYKKIDKIFSQSRFLYFKKHYGILWAWIVKVFLYSRRKKG